MKLSLIVENSGRALNRIGGDPEITGLTDDSRKVAETVLFLSTVAGEPYLDSVLDSSSPPAAILVPARKMEDPDWKGRLKHYSIRGGSILVSGGRVEEDAGFLASALFGHPSREIKIIGITGTNGKTSTAWMIYHIWKKFGKACGMIGTLGVRLQDAKGSEEAWKTGYTTPRAPEIQEILAGMRERGIRLVVMEVSSEALSLGRLAGTRFAVALFTNLTPDHLDYHGDMESYLQAKRILLDSVREGGGLLVLFTGNETGDRLERVYTPLSRDLHRLVTFSRPLDVQLPVPAEFQKINGTLALYGIQEDVSLSLEELTREALIDLPPVPGRFNLFDLQGKPVHMGAGLPERTTLIDYAHTPDALETLLREVRRLGAKTIITLFGCGGNRDRAKRPVMGRIATELGEIVLLTNDNPRKENPEEIRREIREGMNESGARILDIPDRREAIGRGVELLKGASSLPAVLILAGKGHEEIQIFADRTEVFSDTEEYRKALGLQNFPE